MRHLATLRARFALWTAGLLFAALTAFGVLMYTGLAQGLAKALDDSLRISAAQTIAELDVTDGTIIVTDTVPEESGTAALRARGLSVRVLDRTGRVVDATGPFHGLPVPTARTRRPGTGSAGENFVDLTDSRTNLTVRWYSAPILEDGVLVGTVEVGQTSAGTDAALNRLRTMLILAIPILALLAGLGGYVLATRALAPIDAITSTARRVSGDNLASRLNLPATDDELGRLAATFNAMLARLDDAFRRERQFTADASHELRTPVAAMQAILSVIRTAPRTAPDYEQALADLAEEADRLRVLIEHLLILAHGDARSPESPDTVGPGHPSDALETDAPRQPAEFAPVNLAVLIEDVTDSLRPLAEAKGLTLTCVESPQPEALVTSGDRDSLIRLWVNLLDNAIKYTAQGSIDVRAEVARHETNGHVAMARVTIQDSGQGVSPDHLPYLFDRFYRADPARSTAGSGLGLAIARDIVRRHGGTIALTSSDNAAAGGAAVTRVGTRVTVELPLQGSR